ncbi:MAG: flavin reductase family protein [Hyphomicrobiaceae bacterium]
MTNWAKALLHCFVEGEARFDKDAWQTLETGAPALKGSLATLDCKLVDEHEFKTHSIFIGEVKDGSFREDAQPLLYFRGDFWDVKGR